MGGTKRAVLSVGQRTGSVSRAWSVDAAAVSVIRGGNKAGTGSAWVTVHGAGLGLESSTGKVRMGHTGCQASVWQSDTALTCRMAHGAMGTRRVAMTAGGRGGSVSLLLSVDVGMVSILRRANRARTGSVSMTVHGSSVGIAGMSSRVRTGRTTCEGTSWRSESSIRCIAGQGERGTRRAILTVGHQGASASAAWSWDSGGVSAMQRGNGAGTGSLPVTLHGSGLGLVSQ